MPMPKQLEKVRDFLSKNGASDFIVIAKFPGMDQPFHCTLEGRDSIWRVGVLRVISQHCEKQSQEGLRDPVDMPDMGGLN